MERSKGRSIFSYTERHHIIPKSLGGINDDTNIAVLTAREHYIAHVLLTKMVVGQSKKKMSYALSMFNTNNKNHNRYKPKSVLYDMSRRLLSESMKGRMPSDKCRQAVSLAKKGVPLSDTQKYKMSKSLSKKKSFYAVSNTDEQISGCDLREFCALNGISYNTVIKLLFPLGVITSGKNKGWIFSTTEIIDFREYRNQELNISKSNRSKSAQKYWNIKHELHGIASTTSHWSS